MSRFLRSMLMAAVVALLAAGAAHAQQRDDNARAMEIIAAWQSSSRAPTPEGRAALIEKALQLALAPGPWPFRDPPREALLGQMWGQLGNEYRRVQGPGRPQALERAVAAYMEAEKYTAAGRGADWARVQFGLASTLVDRVGGDRADNLERAIVALGNAADVFTRAGAPGLWGSIQVSLSRAYWHRIAGSRADNVEKSLAAAEAALAVFPRDKEPSDWSSAQQALGAAWWGRIRGSRADNVEKAIAAYEQALTVSTRERQPRSWAGLQDNIGMAYGERVHGEPKENVERAIAAFRAAGEVFTREAHPADWAQLEMNLGNAHLETELGAPAARIEAAIGHFRNALTVYTFPAFPEKWARTSLNLGNAWSARLAGDRADNVEQAIAAYRDALRFYTRDSDPAKWAIVQSNLGNALRRRERGDAVANLAEAAAAFDAALTVQTATAFPRNHLRTARLAGDAAAARGDWAAADRHFRAAIATSTFLFGAGIDRAEAQSVIGEATQLFPGAAFAAVRLGDAAAALDLLEGGKARLLKVALGLDALDLPPAERARLDAMRAEMRDLDGGIERTAGEERQQLVARLEALRARLRAAVTAALAPAGDDPTRQSGRALAASLLARHAALVLPLVTEHGAALLVATAGASGPQVTSVALPALSTGDLDRYLLGADGRGQSEGWLAAYAITLLPPDERQDRIAVFFDAIAGAGPALWRLLAAPMTAALDAAGVARDASVLWVPQGALGLLPVALAGEAGAGGLVLERYALTTAPSLTAAAIAQRRAADAAAPSLAAVINPTGDLAFTDPEGAVAASHFPASARAALDRNSADLDAVLAALRGANYWHFGTHGTFSWAQPRQSGLKLAKEARLTVGRLLDEGGIGRPRLVVLSACESGLYDFQRTPDEFIGLPSTFLQAGAAGVIGTLWPVSDVSTALIMMRFYELHLARGEPPQAALRQAQLWLRAATREELRAFVAQLASSGRVAAEHERLLTRALRGGRASDRPFAHPFHWAAFQFFGA